MTVSKSKSLGTQRTLFSVVTNYEQINYISSTGNPIITQAFTSAVIIFARDYIGIFSDLTLCYTVVSM